MTGDKVVSASHEDNGEKTSDNYDIDLSSNLEEASLETAEYMSCSEFQFLTTTCYICNGYYGPCFDEPVCATCHAFLFPDDIGLLQVPISSEKTDDEDSGNDEPIDLYYNHERRTSRQQRDSPQNGNSNTHGVRNNQDPVADALAQPRVQADARSGLLLPLSLLHCLPGNELHGMVADVGNEGLQRGSRAPNDVETNRRSTGENRQSHDRLSYGNREGVSQSVAVEQFQDNWNQRVCNEPEANEPSMPHRDLSERLEMLTNHRHGEHEPINEPGLVERLPPEVLLIVFSHLDDFSLWSAANVCRRWRGVLSTHITPQQWQRHVKLRWPLYRPLGRVKDWYEVYDRLTTSAPCKTCLTQIAFRSRLPVMEENSWRRNRLRSEHKSLRIDPPEGIEATPLDQMFCHWQATITGPVGSPYEGGLFYLYLRVPYSYPMCPPVVRFLTKILHPNVSRHGDVGIDSIHHNWSLALTISKVLISVQSLLTDPYCQVCMEPELGDMYMNDRDKFEEVARMWTWRYAMHDVITPS